MAMDKTVMAQLILDNIKARNPNAFDGGEEANLQGYLEDFCDGVITHIIAAAVIEVTDVQSGGSSAPGSVTS